MKKRTARLLYALCAFLVAVEGCIGLAEYSLQPSSTPFWLALLSAFLTLVGLLLFVVQINLSSKES